MSSPKPWSRAALLVVLLTAPLLLFGPITLAGRVFLPFLPVADEPLASEYPEAGAEARSTRNGMLGDRVYPFLVDQVGARAELRAGHLPTWEPLQTLGMPLFAGGITALGYPPNWLGLLIPPEHAAAPLAGLALLLVGLGTWLFLRRLGLDPRAAVIGVLGVQLGGWGLANLHYYMKVDAALWLPWCLWAVEGLARGRRWSASALVFALALSFLGGMVTISVFVFAATALYALVRLGPWARGERCGARTLLSTGVLLVLGVAGAAWWLLPLRESSSASLRRPFSVAAASANAQPPTLMLGLLTPDLIGPPDDPTPPSDLPLAWWLTPASMSERAQNANVLEWNTYAGVVLVLLALVAVIAAPRRAAFPGLLLLVCLGFAQGWPVVRWLYALPGLGLGAPQRVLGVAWVLWPWLAAVGAAALLGRAPRALGTLLLGSFAASLGLFQAWAGIDPALWARELQESILARYGTLTSLEEVQARLPLAAGQAAARHLQESLARAASTALALGLAGAAALLLDRKRSHFELGPSWGALALGTLLPLGAVMLPFALSDSMGAAGPRALLGISAVLVMAAFAARTEKSSLALWFPFAALVLVEGFLGSHRHVEGRPTRTAGLFPPSATVEVIREAAGDGRVLRVDATPDLADSQRLARPNMLVPYGLAELTPYPTFTPRQATELARCIDPRMERRNHVAPLPDPALLGHPLLDLMRAQCVLSVAPLQHPRLATVLERPGFCVYRRLGALSPARIVPRALPAESDAQVLEALSDPAVDFAAHTRIAPEDSAGLPPDRTPTPGETPAPGWTPGTIVAFERPAKNRLRVTVTGSSGGWLVLHEQWAAGWRARVNDQQTPILRADHYCRAVALPPGDSTVELEYRPRSLEWGAVLSLLALGGVLAYERLNRN